jgi:5'-3' exonuclease
MGIKHIFPWLIKNFPQILHQIYRDNKKPLTNLNIHTFLVDLNGIIHTRAQEAFEYGAHKKEERLLKSSSVQLSLTYDDRIKKLHSLIIQDIVYLTKFVSPKKRLVVCIDGCAPISKQNQQRQRRFRGKVTFDQNNNSIPAKSDCEFDSNCITPGTDFMKNLSEFLTEEFKKLSTSLNLEIVFSSSNVPGEGEHNCMDFERRYGSPDKTFCIYGVDADLIMLALGAKTQFYVLRNEMYDSRIEFNLINISVEKSEAPRSGVTPISHNLKQYLLEHNIDPINFITMCFFVGNDFLPNVPFIEVSQGSIDRMMKFFKTPLMQENDNSFVINLEGMQTFFESCANDEKNNYEKRFKTKEQWLPSTIMNNSYGIFDLYRKMYYEQDNIQDIEKMVHEYIRGMEWVLNYYIKGVPDWQWKYPYHYAPFSTDIFQYIRTYKSTLFVKNNPTTPFVQLLSVLPQQSSSLLPSSLQQIFLSPKLKEYFPETFKIDLANCKKEWEGHIILPAMNYTELEEQYKPLLQKLTKEELELNSQKKPILFKPDGTISIIKM